MSATAAPGNDKAGKKAKPGKPAPEKPVDEVEASRAPLMEHLIELRTRLVRSAWVLGILFVGGWFVSQQGLDLLLEPFKDAAKSHGKQVVEVVFTAPMELLFIQLKMSFLIALAAGFPFLAWQVYAFVAPGLYKKERMAVLPYMFAMPILFAAGAALVYFSILPIFVNISLDMEFQGTAAKVTYLPQVKPYYELAISLLFAFGAAFQLPVAMSLLARAGVINASALRKGRKYAILIIFVVAAIMTPPDPFSQFILAIPLCVLYESGIICAWLIERGKKKEEARREAEEAAEEAAERKREAAEFAAEAARRNAAVMKLPSADE